MPPPGRRRAGSPVSVALTLFVLALTTVFGLAGLNREANGEPILPDQITHFFTKPDPGLPAGFNYDLSIVDPDTQQTLSTLPQLGTVEIRLAITNDSAVPMTFDFPTSLQSEFIVRRIYHFIGQLFVIPLEVWRSSYFHNYTKRPTTLVLKPGQTRVYTALWTINNLNQSQVPAGEYRVYSSFHGIRDIDIDKPL
jgi:Intracellular proteinase inhibitor